ncbi:hypothetical protein JOD54_004919 [Actinokineospora baliensis]|uniref:hypothetical protein n=1 Tax=Actinokineospora baliensis TaxID=547056 RepID=UPI00195D3DFA|nr:hypothetical protein [Actinokineospora baliensis]MBM7774715.1 hypothetical protein [Actinokineospora baliensis]
MHPSSANENLRLSLWSHVREFAVPPSMIQVATARRVVGDWAGACAAARVDVDLNLRTVRRDRGAEFAGAVRDDLRHLAPDLLRWHYPRAGPDGLLRSGLTVSLARYRPPTGDPVHLVARTPPAWAGAGQRISLALWSPSTPRAGVGDHPHPHPDRRFRLDLHRHLWDVRRAGELGERSGAKQWRGTPHAVHRWAAEAALVLRADKRAGQAVAVRLGSRRRLVLNLLLGNRIAAARARGDTRAHPVLPDAATWVLPDLELLHTGLIDADRLHPLVASALVPDHAVSPNRDNAPSRVVECRGAKHRIGVVNGVLAALDHRPDELRREELLAALGGAPLPCLQAIDEAHRHPDGLDDIRARLDHGDTAGAFAAIEHLLGPDAALRDGPLRDDLESAARHQVLHGWYRAEIVVQGPLKSTGDSKSSRKRQPRP